MKNSSNPSAKIMLVAGEASGDMHGAKLIRSLLNKRPSISCFGFGGRQMEQAGMELIVNLAHKSVIGFVEVLKHWGFFKRSFDLALNLLETRKPDVLVLIDYPGFNLRLAQRAHEMGIRVCYYISPQVWAWKAGRVKKMKHFVDKMLVILPFEKAIYDKEKIDCVFVGNPLVDSVIPSMPSAHYKKQAGWDKDLTLIGLLPGSRIQEINNMLPVMLKTARLISRKIDNCKFIILKAPHLDISLYNTAIEMENHGLNLEVIEEPDDKRAYSARSCFNAALVTSGTATMETAILKTPHIILYKVNPATYYLGKKIIKIDMAGLPNILAGKKIIPEYIQDQLIPETMAKNVCELLQGEEGDKQVASLVPIIKKLGRIGVADRAANEVFRTILG